MSEGQDLYTRNTETAAARPGALALGSIIEARRAGQEPNPADVDAVRALQPAAGPGDGDAIDYAAINVAAVMDNLHGGDPDLQAAAWARIAPLLGDDPADWLADGLDAIRQHAPNPPPITWLVDGWMPEATLSVLTGAGGAGKSRIALQLAVAVATGETRFVWPSGTRRPVNCHAPTVKGSGPVVYAAWETRRLAFANRLAAICGRHMPWDQADSPERLSGQLHYLNMRPAGGLWGAAAGAHTSTAGGWLPGGQALRRYAERANARLLIIDPLAAAFVANENDRALVRAFLSALDQWAEDTGCTVLIISHPPKSDSAQSGSTDWRNGVQAVWELAAADTNDPRQLKVDKLNEGPTPNPVFVDYEAGAFAEVNTAINGQDKTKGQNIDTNDL